jgi:hypothetical protein
MDSSQIEVRGGKGVELKISIFTILQGSMPPSRQAQGGLASLGWKNIACTCGKFGGLIRI